MKFRALAVVTALAAGSLAACGSGSLGGSASFEVSPGWEQVTITGAAPGTMLELVAGESVAQMGNVDDQGALLFRKVEAGTYVVRSAGDDPESSGDVVVLDETAPPPEGLYEDQQVPAPGFGYVTTRDGTTLSINVALPGDAADGPFPTVVEYSGYDPSNPGNTTFAAAFNALGYAYVGVNMRGTGCSGGSFRFFELMQRLDAYDVIEAIAAQPWVLGNKVGMVGISYPGISQLFAASTQPPSLAAITPLSPLDDSVRSTLYPGGILNTGFAVSWTSERMEQSKPFGQGWERGLVDAGDTVCEANQLLRGQNPDLLAEIEANTTYTDEIGAEINPLEFIGEISVPVFIAGAWQDEQTGGRFATMLDKFANAPQVYAYLTNGLHTESLASTGIFPRLVEFLDLYVAERVPDLGTAAVVAATLGATVTGAAGAAVGASPYAEMTYPEALAAYEAAPRVNVLFEEGAADGVAPGAASPRWISSFASWPVPDAAPESFYLGPNATLTSSPPTASDQVDTYVADPAAVPETFYSGSLSDIWKADVAWNWVRNPSGTAAAYTSAPFSASSVYIGSGSADLWVKSSSADTDVEVTLSEIRPDGQEVYVQSGWLRGSLRAVDESSSSETRPVHEFRAEDNSPMASATWNLMRVEIFPFAHAFRAGSRLRVTVDAPGGNRAQWVFRTIAAGETVSIARSAVHPSRIVLAKVPGVEVPAAYPTCTLRGQPCRPVG